ncbi:uncharacterized protein LOC103309122 isoform X2 [Acyrthosiphon pisum]|uniref:Uncharacterized protein n=1 Tax=Acyrthosiphon pisum TaxID=7029 RepID=A0A8R2NR30_ACYPI|nr:uncharacterized protein LOC103309122 isoform X2 [Acyrthosiphon pisum]
MISHKNLIILTVLFEITIFSNGEKTTEEIKQCKKHLEIMGFNLESGFYNYNYVLQFENVEKLINHVKTRITVENGTIKPVPKQTAIVNDVTLPGTIGHLHTIYKKINDARDTELEEIIMTPNQFCTFYYEHREKSKPA